MSKILLCSDLHIHPHKKSTDRLHDCIKALEWIFETAKEHSIDDIVFAGDLFQDRQKIDLFTYDLTYRTFEKYCDGSIEVWLLLGNHDLWYYDKWDVNSVHPFGALEEVTVIDCPCTLKVAGCNIDFLPFTHDPVEHLSTFRKEGQSDILVGHLAVDKAQMNTTYHTYADIVIEHDGEMVRVDQELFKGWKQVWLGHYHGAQRIPPNIEYIGSPLQLNFGEAFQKKHIIIYDLKTGDKEYIENKFSPRHYVISKDKVDKINLENNFVRVNVEDIGASDLIDLRKDLEKKSPSTLEIIATASKQDDPNVKDAKAILYNEEEMLEKYVEQTDVGDLEEKKLLKIGKGICHHI